MEFEGIYSKETKDLHKAWAERLRFTATAKVEVVFGSENKWSMSKSLTLEPLILWTTPPVTINLQFGNKSKSSISPVIIFANYPKHLFKNISRDAALDMDKQLKVANALSGCPPRPADIATFFYGTIRCVRIQRKQEGGHEAEEESRWNICRG